MLIYNHDTKQSFLLSNLPTMTLILTNREYTKLLMRMLKEIMEVSRLRPSSSFYIGLMPSSKKLCADLKRLLEFAVAFSCYQRDIIESIAIKYYRRNENKIL